MDILLSLYNYFQLIISILTVFGLFLSILGNKNLFLTLFRSKKIKEYVRERVFYRLKKIGRIRNLNMKLEKVEKNYLSSSTF